MQRHTITLISMQCLSHTLNSTVCTTTESCRIAERREAVNSRRQRVKQLSAERKAKLLDSLAWQKFCRDVDEVRVSHDSHVTCIIIWLSHDVESDAFMFVRQYTCTYMSGSCL